MILNLMSTALWQSARAVFRMLARKAIVLPLIVVLASAPSMATAGEGTVTLIHIGDIHGHLVPRPNVRSDNVGKMEGGLARMYTAIEQIRERARDGKLDTSLLVNTGDTLQGSGEALFTRGQAMVDVLNLFGIQAYTPGNWDFLYGPPRFEEMFIGTGDQAPIAPWNAVAANLYYSDKRDPGASCGITDANGNALKRVLPAYSIRQVGNLKIGILGFTTARAIAAIGPKVTEGYQFTDGKVELPCYIDQLRNREKVDLVVMISELELARDIQLVETNPGVNVVLNSDMHERATQPIVIKHDGAADTILVEEGQDGTMVGEIKLTVKAGHAPEWEWSPHVITSDYEEDPAVRAKVTEVRRPFVKGTFIPGQQVTIGGNTTTLARPVDEVVAHTELDLHRSNFMDEDMPAVAEGSAHDLIVDGMRWAAQADAATIRGFRYGTHVPAGSPITMEDIYHFVPIAAKLGRVTACGADLKMQVENSTRKVFDPDPGRWGGGWLFGYSGLTFGLDACGGFDIPGFPAERGSNIKMNGASINTADAYDVATNACKSGAEGYKVAGYWYADDPTTINNCPQCRGRSIEVMGSELRPVSLAADRPLPDTSKLLDVTEAIVKYLRGELGGTVTEANLPLHRINVKRLPTRNPYPFKVIQPLNGSRAATCPNNARSAQAPDGGSRLSAQSGWRGGR
jgi:S-sulfosulfanyl-L-cysteine sulfohydrolase